VLKYIEGCQCSIGTVLCCNGVSAHGLRGSKMVVQGLNMRKEQDQNMKETVHACMRVSHSKTFIL
jgi:hypothetical protein